MKFGPEGDIILLDLMVTILFISQQISLFILRIVKECRNLEAMFLDSVA